MKSFLAVFLMLVTISICGCGSGGGSSAPLVVNVSPVAMVTPSAGSAIAGYTNIELSGEGSSDPDGTIVSYSWDIDGDGVEDRSGSRITVSFPELGDHTVALTVTDNGGRTASASATVTMMPDTRTPPNVNVAPVKNSSGVVDRLTILAFSTDGCDIDTSSVRVDLGDGSAPQYANYTGTADGVATFSITGLTTNEGSYTASIQVRDTEGLSTSLSAQYEIAYPTITINATGIPAGTGVEPHNVLEHILGYMQNTITGSVDTVPASPIAFTYNKNTSYVLFKSDVSSAGRGYHLNFTNYVGVCTNSTPGYDRLEIWSYGTTTSYEGTLDHDVVIDLNYSSWGGYTGYGMCSY